MNTQNESIGGLKSERKSTMSLKYD